MQHEFWTDKNYIDKKKTDVSIICFWFLDQYGFICVNLQTLFVWYRSVYLIILFIGDSVNIKN